MKKFQYLIETQNPIKVSIERTCRGGWICLYKDKELFLPKNQLYKNINDYESCVGKAVTVLVQRVDWNRIVVSHKEYIIKILERKRILQILTRQQQLNGIVKGKNDKGYLISVLGIIGFMPNNAVINSRELHYGQSLDFAVLKSDPEKSLLILSEKLLTNIKKRKSILQKIEKPKIGDEIKGRILKITSTGYIVELHENITGLLKFDEVPAKKKYEINDEVSAIIFNINNNIGNISLSIKKLIDLKWSKLEALIQSKVIPGETELVGRVVYIERTLATLCFNYEKETFYGYIKNEDLAWEKVSNASDVVFLGEELTVRYLYAENRRLFFDLKWQQKDLYPSNLFEMDIDELLTSLNIHDNKFIGQFSSLYVKNQVTGESELSGGIVSNLIALGDADKNTQIVDKYTGTNITAFVPIRYAFGLKNGKYYRFKLNVAPEKKRHNEHRPYMFVVELDGGAIAIDNPFKLQVEKSFKENKTPKSNRELAKNLKEFGADMYSDRDRMFYELLQNADDASSVRGVKVMVQIKDNYLIFTHDGLSFSRQDFRAIVSTANSTKRLDRKKTGYKGIGFKSVFTDSEKVYIKTGGFFFVFDKNSEIFNNFRDFYSYVNPLYTEQQLQVFFEENAEYEEEFEKVDHLPWQILPFWVDECPEELRGSTFMRNCNVAIALKLDATADKYRDLIKGIIQKPRFMLFLRNTQRIQFEDKKWEILSIAKQTDIQTGVVRLKNSFANTEEEVSYIVKEGNDIPVSNEYFGVCNIPLKKECDKASGREKWKMYQIIDEVSIPVTSIPERIIAADTTTLSFAFMLNEKGQVMPIPDKTPSLYAYLPMEDRRYLFPFFINADFELSSNRQEAKRVSVWNEFIFYNIGKNIVSWVSSLATGQHPLYLSLLPQEFLTEELEESKIDRLAYQFNRGYKEALASVNFILDFKNSIVSQNDIVLDESGFANVIGAEDFCYLLGLDKRLPSNTIEASALFNESIFNTIEHLQSSDIVSAIVDYQNRYRILRYWISLTNEKRIAILKHIVSMPRNKKNLIQHLADIPAFTCGKKCLTFNKLFASSKYVLKTDFVHPIYDILENLGFVITNEDESKHPFHEEFAQFVEAYKIHIFEVVSQCTAFKFGSISPKDKIRLFQHFSNTKYGLKQESIAAWKIFVNQDGVVLPLNELTHVDSSLYDGITSQFVINEEEYVGAPKLLEHYMMKEKDQFIKISVNKWDSLASRVSSETLAISLYKFIVATYTMAEHERAEKEIASLISESFVYVSSGMKELSDVIISNKLSKASAARECIEYLTSKEIPSVDIIKYLSDTPFKCPEEKIENLTLDTEKNVSGEQMLSLLTYCKDNKDTIFTNYYLSAADNGYILSKLATNSIVGYTSDDRLSAFIERNCSTIKLLPKSLCNFSSLKGIIADEELLVKVLDSFVSIDPFVVDLLPIFVDSLSSAKKSFIEHLSRIELNENSFLDEKEHSIVLLKLASTVEKPDADFYGLIRNKIYINSDNTINALSGIKLQHTIEVNDIKYPLAKLLPNEDKLAILADTLKERAGEFLTQSFVDNLFGDEVDEGMAGSVYATLNNSSTTLSNGAQLAFVLEYAKYNKILSKNLCKVTNAAGTPVPVCQYWLLKDFNFVDKSYILGAQYVDVEKYLTLPYVLDNNKCELQNKFSNYAYLKSSLSDEETKSLLDFMYGQFKRKISISDKELSIINMCLSIVGKDYIIANKYALESEMLPKQIECWRKSDCEKERNLFLSSVFGFLDEDSDVVIVRQFLNGESKQVINNNTERLSKMTCNWIMGKAMDLTDGQFAIIQDILEEHDFKLVLDSHSLDNYASTEYRFLAFGDYYVYQYPGQIPHKACMGADSYVFHTYSEGNIAIKGNEIFVNEECLQQISSLVKSLINSNGFSADDFVQFLDAYQSKLSGSLEGEEDNDLDEDGRGAASELAKKEALNWLSAKGYNTNNIQEEYSCLSGISKEGKSYNIVVKSFRSKKRELKVNPNEWLHLLKPNSRLILYLGHMSFAVIDREKLLGNYDFLRLRIASSNFSLDNGKLDHTLTQLAESIQYFERTHFIFEHVNESILTRANSLESYGLFQSHSDEEFTTGSEEDI